MYRKINITIHFFEVLKKAKQFNAEIKIYPYIIAYHYTKVFFFSDPSIFCMHSIVTDNSLLPLCHIRGNHWCLHTL